MPPVLNIVAFRSVAIDDLPALRTCLLQRAEADALKGGALKGLR